MSRIANAYYVEGNTHDWEENRTWLVAAYHNRAEAEKHREGLFLEAEKLGLADGHEPSFDLRMEASEARSWLCGERYGVPELPDEARDYTMLQAAQALKFQALYELDPDSLAVERFGVKHRVRELKLWDSFDQWRKRDRDETGDASQTEDAGGEKDD